MHAKFSWCDVIKAGNTSDFGSQVDQRTDPHNNPLTDCYKNWCKTYNQPCLAEEWDVILVFTSPGGHRSHWNGIFLDEILNISVISIILFARLGVRLSGLARIWESCNENIHWNVQGGTVLAGGSAYLRCCDTAIQRYHLMPHTGYGMDPLSLCWAQMAWERWGDQNKKVQGLPPPLVRGGAVIAGLLRNIKPNTLVPSDPVGERLYSY